MQSIADYTFPYAMTRKQFGEPVGNFQVWIGFFNWTSNIGD
jgi:hypothetical protein